MLKADFFDSISLGAARQRELKNGSITFEKRSAAGAR